MRYTERNELLYDPELFKRVDVATAARFHSEAVKKMSPQPPPKFFEVNRKDSKVDPLWHMPLDGRTTFDRELEIPCIVKQDRPDWRLTKVGMVPKQKCTFWMDNLLLKEADYFPSRGDFVWYNGYRNLIINVVLEPNGFWQQTNVWLGLIVETIIPVDGDARPLAEPAVAAISEIRQTRPLPEA